MWIYKLVKNPPACMYQFDSWVERSPGEGKDYPLQYSWASLVTQMIKNLPSMWEIWVRSLGWEDSLAEGMAIQSSIFLEGFLPQSTTLWPQPKTNDFDGPTRVSHPPVRLGALLVLPLHLTPPR